MLKFNIFCIKTNIKDTVYISLELSQSYLQFLENRLRHEDTNQFLVKTDFVKLLQFSKKNSWYGDL